MASHTGRVIKTRSVIFAPNRDKSLRGDAQRSKFKASRPSVSYDIDKRLQFWLNHKIVSIRNEVSNGQ